MYPEFATGVFMDLKEGVPLQPYVSMVFEAFGETYGASLLHPKFRTIGQQVCPACLSHDFNVFLHKRFIGIGMHPKFSDNENDSYENGDVP